MSRSTMRRSSKSELSDEACCDGACCSSCRQHSARACAWHVRASLDSLKMLPAARSGAGNLTHSATYLRQALQVHQWCFGRQRGAACQLGFQRHCENALRKRKLRVHCGRHVQGRPATRH